MSRCGNYWDNTPQESFYGHTKDELHLESCTTFAQLKEEIDPYMNYYNNLFFESTLSFLTLTKDTVSHTFS
ncbi:IS3 family transposase [Clostridium puniceum]|uniref:IS3 family transposase n=1 Tax=Clostridium puniceum TaxID=29367 RepID=UPI00098CD4E5